MFDHIFLLHGGDLGLKDWLTLLLMLGLLIMLPILLVVFLIYKVFNRRH